MFVTGGPPTGGRTPACRTVRQPCSLILLLEYFFTTNSIFLGNMLSAGDFDLMRVVLDYLSNLETFLNQRSLAYWNHTGAIIVAL